MGNEDLVESVLRLADADPDLTEDAKLVVLAALESDAQLAEAIAGDADAPKLPPPLLSGAQAPREPVGAFLRAIRVKGFRGIGPEANLPIHPAPGLTVVCGRNGSGKSSFAEAFELALTGESYRWKEKKTVRWKEHWRNIHDGSPCSIRVELAEEGTGVTTIGLDWAADADLDDRTTWVQRAGQRREAGLDSLGWALPMELYRPMLSYDELGGRLEAEPSKLHDQLANILGLERITDAQQRVSQALKRLQQPQTDAKAALVELRKALAASDDARASQALGMVARKTPDLDAAEQLFTGNLAESNGHWSQLQVLAELRIPTTDEAQQAAIDLRATVSEMAEHSGTLLDLTERRVGLLRAAVSFHEHHGDTDCPVCGVGQLDAQWRAHIDAELSGYELRGWLDREAAEILRSALSPLAAPRPATDTEVDLRDAAQRDADALVEFAQRALEGGELPTEGGERPQVVVTVSLAVLQGRIGSASLALGGPINADVARRIACDAQLIPVVLGSRGEPPDVGRASHTVPTAIRRAVLLRDRGCAFPGCSAPARWCEIHHIIHWANHGPTSIDNCVALCGRHHRLLHHSDWWIEMTSGVPQFHPPPWLGGPPRRNPLHLTPDLIRIRE